MVNDITQGRYVCRYQAWFAEPDRAIPSTAPRQTMLNFTYRSMNITSLVIERNTYKGPRLLQSDAKHWAPVKTFSKLFRHL